MSLYVKRLTDNRPKHDAVGADAMEARPLGSSSDRDTGLCHRLDLHSNHMTEQKSLVFAQRYYQRIGQPGARARGIPIQ